MPPFLVQKSITCANGNQHIINHLVDWPFFGNAHFQDMPVANSDTHVRGISRTKDAAMDTMWLDIFPSQFQNPATCGRGSSQGLSSTRGSEFVSPLPLRIRSYPRVNNSPASGANPGKENTHGR